MRRNTVAEVDDEPVVPPADADSTVISTWHLGAGVGYEFRPHFMIECMAGYSRFTIPDSYAYGWRVRDADLHLNKITLFVSVNYLFY